jgi:hypothetical protein
MLTTILLSAMFWGPQPTIVDATPISPTHVLLSYSDGRFGLTEINPLSPTDSPVTTISMTGTPTILRLTYRSVEGEMQVEEDCRSHTTLNDCVAAFRRAVTAMQAAFPKVPDNG